MIIMPACLASSASQEVAGGASELFHRGHRLLPQSDAGLFGNLVTGGMVRFSGRSCVDHDAPRRVRRVKSRRVVT
jgi:hypothetical protein